MYTVGCLEHLQLKELCGPGLLGDDGFQGLELRTQGILAMELLTLLGA